MGDALSSEHADGADVKGQIPVHLNIYDLGTTCGGKILNGLLSPFGTGAFHCGVEILGYEWSFRSTPGWKGNGVFWCEPRRCKGHNYSESILMGYSIRSEVEVLLILQKLMGSWCAADYHVLRRNCCHFSDEVCKRLGVGGIPSRVRNLADASAAATGPLCGFLLCNASKSLGDEEDDDGEVFSRHRLRSWSYDDATGEMLRAPAPGL
uniref:PPPDE domain-containing protein n=1 Tax=Alexandrium andersonii TaxID=327968 RepID=A0A7S2FIS2_9DINO